MSQPILRIVPPNALPTLDRAPVIPEAREQAQTIIDDVRKERIAALARYADAFDGVSIGEPLVRSRQALDAARDALNPKTRRVLETTAERIRTFAEVQKSALQPAEIEIPGGAAGHTISAVDVAGCYAPGGRFPLPSTVLMTAVTARVAGVKKIWVASPRPTAETLAAASVAGADGLLTVGGAQAIAAMAYGVGLDPCDVIVGPGNRWVTAAKQILSGVVGIDMLAGPSELVVLADDSANPAWVAADLLGQAEHDTDALPILVTPSESLLAAVQNELAVQIEGLPTAETARAAVRQGFAVPVADLSEGTRVCDALAPEHLQIMTKDAQAVASACRHYGGIFIGAGSAEVIGDYGAGPNHTLPTGRAARYTGGLSVFDFLRVRTWLRIDDPVSAQPLYEDAEALADLEGLRAHARAATLRHPGGLQPGNKS